LSVVSADATPRSAVCFGASGHAGDASVHSLCGRVPLRDISNVAPPARSTTTRVGPSFGTSIFGSSNSAEPGGNICRNSCSLTS
jgi:hypothetical protein